MKYLRKLEESLLQNKIRSNRDKLNELLHQDFIEIGYSGKTYTKANVLVDLPNQQSLDIELWSQDYSFMTLSTDTVLLTYKQASINHNGQLIRHAKRSSIWFNNKGSWQMKFHQATPTAPFEKSNT